MTLQQIKSRFHFQKLGNGMLVISFFVGVVIACISRFAHGEILFEGYSKVLSGSIPIGYSISRYEYDQKKKQFIATTFLKTNQLGGDLTESLKAYADENLQPISYNYTTLVGKQAKMIDATFKKGKMTATIRENGKIKKTTVSVPKEKGIFLSTFLVYIMLKSPKGLQDDSTYNFEAIAEEDATISKGSAIVKGEDSFNGIKGLKVQNDFKGAKFNCIITSKGEILSTKSPVLGIGTELVSKPSEATASFQIPNAVLTSLFGEVPTGQKNEVSRKALTPAGSPNKQEGVPAGKGIQIKTQQNTEENTQHSEDNDKKNGSGK